jgi:5-formyltetrahydrofolate cyclo-ligase
LSEKLAALSVHQIEEESLRLVTLLQTWAPPRGFEMVLATLPLAGEADLTPFLTWWLKAGRRAAFARTGPQRSMEFREVFDLSGPWETKPFGMKEPPASAPVWEPGLPTLALVPGLAFTAAPGRGAFRLGRGAGYYDRWLAQFGKAVFALGVGLSVQSVERVPLEPHDWPLDGWIDPQGFHGEESEQ